MRIAVALLGLAVVAGCSKGIEERNWVTMGTTASVKAKGASSDFVNRWTNFSREVTVEIEQLLNAHDAKSELSQLAPLTDAEIVAKCNPLVKPCYEAAFELRDQSGGAFNPRWKGEKTMDLGGIAKGYAVDIMSDTVLNLTTVALAPCLFDVGGNLRSASGTWTVGIAGSDEVIELKDGEACATSAEYFRGKHIYDARTGRAVTNDLLSVTIIHPSSAMLADGLSTICFILGEKEGEAFLKKFYPEARAIWIRKE